LLQTPYGVVMEVKHEVVCSLIL